MILLDISEEAGDNEMSEKDMLISDFLSTKPVQDDFFSSITLESEVPKNSFQADLFDIFEKQTNPNYTDQDPC